MSEKKEPTLDLAPDSVLARATQARGDIFPNGSRSRTHRRKPTTW